MKELIDEAVKDLSCKGKFETLYQSLLDLIDLSYSDEEIEEIKYTLIHVGIDPINMSKPEILFNYSKLI